MEAPPDVFRGVEMQMKDSAMNPMQIVVYAEGLATCSAQGAEVDDGVPEVLFLLFLFLLLLRGELRRGCHCSKQS